MRIRVRVQYCDVVELDAKTIETVGDIKEELCKREGISTNKLRLMYDLVVLNDEQTISALGLSDGSLLFADFQDPAAKRLLIEISKDEKFAVAASSHDSVEALKVKIEARLGIPASELRLMVSDGSELEDGQTLSAYDLRDGSNIRLTHIPRLLIYINVIVLHGRIRKTIRMRVRQSDLVKSVSMRLEASLGIAAGDWLLLKDDDEPLDSDGILSDYNICDGEVLYVVGIWPPRKKRSRTTISS